MFKIFRFSLFSVLIFLEIITRNSNLNAFDPSVPLFSYYPSLSEKIPYISLGSFPTPIYRYNISSTHDHQVTLFIKDDGLSGTLLPDGSHEFGGNKVRKLEFALADALNQNANTTITYGALGSNHALATAIYAKKLGLKPISLLCPQPLSDIVLRNILLQHHHDTELHLCLSKESLVSTTLFVSAKQLKLNGIIPYIIPTGASYPIGIIGFVNAAYELKEQIDAGILSMPDYIYVPAGSFGTYVGLKIGCKALGLPIQIIGISIEPIEKTKRTEKILSLLCKTNNLLHQADPTFPLFDWKESDIHIIDDFTGLGYGIFTQEGIKTQALPSLPVTLDGVYSAKAFAGLLNHLEHGLLDNKTVLFWHTFCSTVDTTMLKQYTYLNLPIDFHQCFK